MGKNIKTITKIEYDNYEEATQDVGLYGVMDRCFINENGIITVEWLREGLPENATPQQPRLEPTLLPPHMKVKLEASIETKDLEALSKVLNHVDKYWPGMQLFQYGIAQRVGNEALALVTMINYPIEEELANEEPEITIEEIDEDELGDIMYNE